MQPIICRMLRPKSVSKAFVFYVFVIIGFLLTFQFTGEFTFSRVLFNRVSSDNDESASNHGGQREEATVDQSLIFSRLSAFHLEQDDDLGEGDQNLVRNQNKKGQDELSEEHEIIVQLLEASKPVRPSEGHGVTQRSKVMTQSQAEKHPAEQNASVEEVIRNSRKKEESLVPRSEILTKFQNRADDSEIETNRKWKETRERLLGLQRVSKVIVMAYARGGSTLCSDVFNIDVNTTVLWYEALHGFHAYYSGLPEGTNEMNLLYNDDLTRKIWSPQKITDMTKYMIDLFDFNLKDIPIQMLAHDVFMKKGNAFLPFMDCMTKNNAFKILAQCDNFLRRHCFYEELYNSFYKTRSSFLSSLRCDDVLKSVRRWDPPNVNLEASTELLVRYTRDHARSDVRNIIIKNCNDIRTQFLDIDASLTAAESEPGQPSVNDNAPSLVLRPENGVAFGGTHIKYQCNIAKYKFLDFIKYHSCEKSLVKRTFYCRDAFNKLKSRTNLAVLEVHRTFVADLELLIQRVPDIHIVHYIRDPRAIAVSRAEKNYHTFKTQLTWTAVNESKILCMRMRYDLEESKRLQRIYPGSIKTVRYEDLVLDPMKTVSTMYDYFDRSLPVGLDQWIGRNLNARTDNGMYGVERRNGKIHIDRWRSKLRKNQIDDMNRNCEDILLEFDYR